MQRLRERFAQHFPEVSIIVQTGDWLIPSLTRENRSDRYSNRGSDLDESFAFASPWLARVNALSSVNDWLIPQDLDYPGRNEYRSRTCGPARHIAGGGA